MRNLNRIKAVLAEKGISGRVLAKSLGKADTTISGWCRNLNQPRIQDLPDIAKALGGIPVGSLLVDHPED